MPNDCLSISHMSTALYTSFFTAWNIFPMWLYCIRNNFLLYFLCIFQKHGQHQQQNENSTINITVILLLYDFFCVIPRRLNFICQHFRTLCLFHLHRPMKMEQTECSEHWLIIFRHRGITQKKAYNIQNMAKVWNHVIL
jgi:hypothetical protein